MPQDYGIKIVKAGKSITTTDLRDIIFSSKFSMLKYHSTATGSVVFNAGDQNKYVDFSHGLGYVPAFFAYLSASAIEGGKERMIPGYTWSNLTPSGAYSNTGFSSAYANSSVIRCMYNLFSPYNQVTVGANQIYHELDTGSVNILAGNSGGSGYSSAVRFGGVPLNRNQSLVSAELEWGNQFSGPTNSNTKMKIQGIANDNVGDVGTWYPGTTAVKLQEMPKSGGFFNFGTDVKSIVEEIIARSGWSNGNNMGFMNFNDGSPNDAYVGGNNDSYATLKLVVSGSMTVNFRVIIFKDKVL